jgi:hypothetical protein
MTNGPCLPQPKQEQHKPATTITNDTSTRTPYDNVIAIARMTTTTILRQPLRTSPRQPLRKSLRLPLRLGLRPRRQRGRKDPGNNTINQPAMCTKLHLNSCRNKASIVTAMGANQEFRPARVTLECECYDGTGTLHFAFTLSQRSPHLPPPCRNRCRFLMPRPWLGM